ncbi:MAG TPA: pseudaminic acid cytidylyltransferase [Candidatus Sulfotelmatobacter sp.]|jgi:N-acylneuraminate cytidylyltransferase|nr:pseudaminic acid cytidylyltransferase [Candidatus Sulfotelmatobacter sp.]
MKVAVIPARGGSKRIPRKNIRHFGDKPMLAHPLLAARHSGIFDHIIISTDDNEIADIACQWGGEVPFIRPPELADDFSDTGAVVAHAAAWMRERGWTVDAICCIYATAPFVLAQDLVRGWDVFANGGWDLVFSATTFAFPIQRAFRQLPGGGIMLFQPEYLHTRSQDLEEAYHDAGQFYWATGAGWEAGKAVFGENATPVILPRWRVQDIDTQEDWSQAEIIWKVINP